MKNKRLIILFFVLALSNRLYGGSVIPVPAIPGAPASDTYQVWVNGTRVPVNDESYFDFHTAFFTMDGPVTVRVQLNGDAEFASIHPVRHQIDVRRSGDSISFTLDKPLKLVIKLKKGENLLPLALCATPPEKGAPSPDDEGVLYFGPGTSEPGPIKATSGQTIYLAPGALVKGRIEVQNAEHVTICGRGTLDARGYSVREDKTGAILFDRCKDVHIDGIGVRGGSWWMTLFLLTDDASATDMNLFGKTVNTDGIDIDGVTNFVARDCFIRCEDDGFGWHALDAKANGEPPTTNCLAEDCVIWNTAAGNGLRVGASMETGLFRDITFRNIDVLEHAGAAIYSDHSDWAKCQNIHFENFHIESAGQKGRQAITMYIAKTRYSNMTGFRDARGHYDGLHFIDVIMPADTRFTLNGHSAAHRINNVFITDCIRGGEPIDSLDDIETNEFVGPVTFKSSTEANGSSHNVGISAYCAPEKREASGQHTDTSVAGTIVPIPATPGVMADARFALKVNGEKVFVGEEVSRNKRLAIAYFDIEGEADVEVEVSEEFSDVKVMPSRYRIEPKKEGKTLLFQISGPGHFVVRVEGVGDLLLVATPLEKEVPNPDDPNVHYFGPGTHDVGRLKVKSNETVYIAGGARVFGTIEGEEVHNVRILGRGVLDGSKHTTWEDRIFTLVFDRSSNIKIDGIRIREAYWWVTEFLLCKNVQINNFFIFSNHRNNGGIMADGCTELTVRNSFFITDDDCICPHALNAAGNGEPVGDHFLFEDCVLWQTGSGNCIRIGASFETSQVLNWTFRGIDCIGHTGAAIISDHSDWATVRNLRFIDVHDEQAKGWTVNMFIDKTRYSCNTGYRDERGHFDGLYFVNLTSTGGGIRLIGHDPDHTFNDVRFYNCKIGSSSIDSIDDLTVNEYVTDVSFYTDGSKPKPDTLLPPKLPAANSPEQLFIDNTSAQFRGIGFEFKDNKPGSIGDDLHVATVPRGFSNFKAAIYEPSIEGEYDIYIHWGHFKNKATNARWIVRHTGGYSTKYLDQNESAGWHYHGRYRLDANSSVRLALPGYFSTADNPVVADSVKFVAVPGN